MQSYRPVKKILCALDFSQFSGHTLQQALELAQGLGAEVIFLNVVNQAMFDNLERISGRLQIFEGTLDQAMATMQEERAQRLKALLQEHQAHQVPHTSRIAVGVPWEKILEVAGEEQVDLIVMGTKGRGSLTQRLRFGSSAEKVFRRAACRVMFVR